MDLIQHNQVDKVSKLLDRGFDPNYHDSETGGKAVYEHKHLKQTKSSDLKLNIIKCLNLTFDLWPPVFFRHQDVLPNRYLYL